MRNGEKTMFDRLFENDMNYMIERARQNYDNMVYREALKFVFFELVATREEYRIMSGTFHRELFERYLEVQLILLSPIAPHICERLW